MESGAAPARVPGQKQFPCGQCGAKLDFAPGTDTLKCPYCGSSTRIPQSEEHIEELDFRKYLEAAALEQGTQELQRVKCQKCGAETTVPPEVASSICPFCGDNLVLAASTSRQIQPRSLLPFKIPRPQAFSAFRDWISGLWFAPGDLKQYAQSEGKLIGVYVPYWTYDSDTTSYYRGQRGDDYWVTETYTETENGRSVTKTRDVKRTRWSSVGGTVWNEFDDILVLASKSLPGAYAGRLEPWDLSNLVPYSQEYLSGFRAESYQVKLAEGFEVAKQVMDGRIRQTICEDIGGDHQRIDSVKTGYGKITFKHILLPVWMSAYRYRDKVFRILINARTGEVQGERPFSAWKIAAAVAAAILVIIAIVIIVQLNQS
jgi:DNA-directed RNA polymerase subunit RPC12/RpoP